jgi:hypothetical protein
MEGRKIIMGLKIIVNYHTFGYGIRKRSSLRLLSLPLSCIVLKFGDAISLENPQEI